MFDLSDISKKKIKEFAGEVIYNRGLEYFQSDLVHDFEYDPKLFSFNALVYGRSGYYDVEIWNNQGHLEAYCNCPYDGYPCKHIVAVLLYFLENKSQYLAELEEQRNLDSKMYKELSRLPKDELIKMMLSFSKYHPPLRRELLLRLPIDSEKSFKFFETAIDKIFRKFEGTDISTYDISREIKNILKQVESANPDLQLEVMWKVTNGILFRLNEYGMNDIPLEDLALSTLDKIADLFREIPGLKENNPEIISELKEYCDWQNCGITDEICDIYYAITEPDE